MICPSCSAAIGEHVTEYGDHACPSCGLAGPREVLEALAKRLETGEFYRERHGKAWEATIELRDRMRAPVPMLLFCPACSAQHVDEPQPEKGWTNPPHRSHECQGCGHVWRPADVATTGVPYISTKGERDGVPAPQDPPPHFILAEAERLLRERGAYQMILRVRGGGVSLRRMRLRANANYSGPTLPEAYVRMGGGAT